MTAGRSHTCGGRGGAGSDHGNVIVVEREICGGCEMGVVTGERGGGGGGGEGDRAPESEQHFCLLSLEPRTVSTVVGCCDARGVISLAVLVFPIYGNFCYTWPNFSPVY